VIGQPLGESRNRAPGDPLQHIAQARERIDGMRIGGGKDAISPASIFTT
jgi:hypothetical protein